jgi:hypothetical protein
MSCDFCTNPLYVGTKCKNCGREAAHVPVKTFHGGKPWPLQPATEESSAVQPAVPDAIHHTDMSESLEYIQGWNDCRAEMLKGMKP